MFIGRKRGIQFTDFAQRLIPVGPFANLGYLLMGELPSLYVTTSGVHISGDLGTNNASNPYKFRNVYLEANTTWYASYYRVTIWCDTLYLGNNSVIDVNGVDGYWFDEGSKGGAGAAGGGGGCEGISTKFGGDGASEGNGSDSGDGYSTGGEGIPVTALDDTYSLVKNGGDGGDGGGVYAGLGGTHGISQKGWGAGGGAGSQDTFDLINGPGGGGGAGFILIVSRKIIGGSCTFTAVGGEGGKGDGVSEGGGAGGGGGGVVIVYAKQYNNNITANVSGGLRGTAPFIDGGDGKAGAASIYKINTNNTTALDLFTNFWNNTY